MTSRVPDVAGLRLLAAVAETGSLGAAARRLGMAQPNASRMLARLETDLGLSLVERTPRGSHLTAAGRLVAEWAAPVLTSLDRVATSAASLRGDQASHLVVGASLTVGEHLVPAWLSSFRPDHPHVQVRLQVMNSADVVHGVEADELDLGFIETPDVPSHLHALVVGQDELALVVAPTHPLARRTDPVGVGELAATALIVREPGSGTRRTLEETLHGHETVAPLMELSSTGAIVQSAVAGLGPAVVSSLAVGAAIRDGSLVRVPVAGASLRRTLRAVWRPSPRMTGAAGDFLLHVSRHPGGDPVTRRDRRVGPAVSSR